MSISKKPPDRYILHQVIAERQEDPEGAIAFYLENAQPDDPHLLKILLEFYAADIYRLSQAILDDKLRSPTDVDDIYSCLDQVFLTAIENRDEFLGKDSLRNWLYAIAISEASRYRRRHKIQLFLDVKSRASRLSHSNQYDSLANSSEINEIWEIIDNLKTNPRNVVILHFLLNLSQEEIAKILNIKEKQVVDICSNGGCDHISIPGETPVEFRNRMTNVLVSRWPRPNLELPKVYQRLNNRLSRKKTGRYSKLYKPHWGQAIILTFITLTILVGITTLSNRDEGGGRPLFPPTPGSLPQPVMALSSNIIDLDEPTERQDNNQGRVLFSTEPKFTKNGDYLVFTSSINTFIPGDTNGDPDIFVLNTNSSMIKRVSISSNGTQGNQSSFSPDISADGRYIVFSSAANNLVQDDFNICNWYGDKISCSDIFIHSVATDRTERVSIADDGTEADNNSYFPVISENGQWVVYWSEASNLTRDSRSICGEGYHVHNCTNLYLHDRVNNTTKVIPIGRQSGIESIEPVSISGDGRFLALTILAEDQVAEQLNLTNQSEALVYDNHFDSFTRININSAGSVGNAESYHPRISTDGRYVAFVSMADNLVPNDTNGRSDIYIHDQVDKTTRLVSMSKDGFTGNADSGTRTIPSIAGWGEHISISDDGRYIAFTSHVNNLGMDKTSSCGHLEKSVCVNVYLYDRTKGQIKLIMSGRGLYSFYVNIEISGGGQKIAIVEQFIRCTELAICSQVWLYDVETERLETPLRDQYQLPGDRSNWPYLSFGQGSKVNAIAFSPDGSTIATGANDSTIKVWDIDGTPRNIIQGHRLPVSDIEFTEDEQHIISSSHDGTVKIWDRNTGRLNKELFRHSSAILGLALSVDGNQLVAGGVGGTWIWKKNKDQFNLSGSIPHPGYYVSDLAFSPNSPYFAMGMSDSTVWIINMDDYETVIRLGGHSERVLDVTFSPNGQFLASGSEDRTLNLWQITPSNGESFYAQHIASVKHPNWVRSVNFSQDGSLLASVALGDKVYLWDMTQSQPLKLLLRISHDAVISLGFSADSQTIAAGTIGGNIHLWHLSELEMEP